MNLLEALFLNAKNRDEPMPLGSIADSITATPEVKKKLTVRKGFTCSELAKLDLPDGPIETKE